MSAIQASVRGRNDVMLEDVENAYADLREFWRMQLDFISQKVNGTADYSDGLSSKDKECLRILGERRCSSKEESNLMIKEYVNLISQVVEVKESTALYYYRKLKDSGLVEAEQVGQYDSRVWLTKRGCALLQP